MLFFRVTIKKISERIVNYVQTHIQYTKFNIPKPSQFCTLFFGNFTSLTICIQIYYSIIVGFSQNLKNSITEQSVGIFCLIFMEFILNNEYKITLSAEAYTRLREYAELRDLSFDAAIIDMADKAGRLVRSNMKLRPVDAVEVEHHLEEERNGIENPYINYKVFTGYPPGTPFFTIMWDYVDVNTKYADLCKRYGGPLDCDRGRRHIICTYKHHASYENKYQSVQLIFTGKEGHPVFGIEYWENGLKANTEVFDSIVSAIMVYKRLVDRITGETQQNYIRTV